MIQIRKILMGRRSDVLEATVLAMATHLRFVCTIAGLVVCGWSIPTLAADASLPDATLEQRRHEDRMNAVREREEQSRDVRRPAAAKEDLGRIPTNESPCFTVHQVALAGPDSKAFNWLLAESAGPDRKDPPAGRCLGAQGINLILRRLQNALIDAGYITSRVSAGPQDLTQGVLSLTLSVGRIHAIRLGEGSAKTSLRTAMPARPGDILNLRDIEHALENLKRLPSAEANIRIEPSPVANESDVVIDYVRTKSLRTTLTVDDSGTQATGRYQGGLILAYDNPFKLNDLAYVSISHDLESKGGYGTNSVLAHYSMPFGFWSFAVTANESRDYQTVAGAFQDYRYRGTSQYADIKISRLVHRDGRSKTFVSTGVFRRASKNYIDDTEVQVQRRAVGGWLMGLNHRAFLGQSVLDLGLTYKQGADWFGALDAPEELFGEGTARFKLTQLDIGFTKPMTVGNRNVVYRGNLRGQWNGAPLTPQDRFAIGGRYTVRGFDGESVLSGDRGWLLHNELATGVGGRAMEVYAGVDVGSVGGQSSKVLPGKTLAGAVVGVRGIWRGVSYDAFVGAPLKKPDGFETADVTVGAALSYSF